MFGVALICGWHAGYSSVSVLILGLVGLWSLRLAWHIGRKILQTKDEDRRYKAWREQWGKFAIIRSFFQVFVLQTIFLYIVALPVILVSLSPDTPLSWIHALGAAIFVCGFVFEWIADEQLRRFKHDPKNTGKILQS